MKRRKITKPVAHKQVFNTLDKYKKLIQSDKSLINEKVDKFISDLSPFLTKKGKLRKNLSNKKIKQFNELVSDFKSQGLHTIKGIRADNQRIINDKRAESWIENNFTDNKDIADQVNEILKDKLVGKLVNKGYISIYHLRDLVEEDIEDTGSIDNIKKVADYIMNQIESETPAEILDYVESQDDLFNLINDLRRNKANIFMTKEVFQEWFNANYDRIKNTIQLPALNKIDYNKEYQRFLEGDYNIVL